LTVRQRSELTPEKKSKEAEVQAASLTKGNPKEELTGVFLLKNKKEAVFVPVTTGISGTTDVEVTNGLKEGDEIVTGSYKVLRTLRNGASVKVDNAVATKKEES
jgi:HlyD family secretion protein